MQLYTLKSQFLISVSFFQLKISEMLLSDKILCVSNSLHVLALDEFFLHFCAVAYGGIG